MATTQAAIRLHDLTKFYGKRRGITALSLEVPQGSIFGYLGPNGAGKTTTIRLLLDLIRPTSGRAEVLGQEVRAAGSALHRRLGYLPGELVLYDQLTGKEFLGYVSNLRGKVDWPHVERLAGRFELDLGRPIRSLSKGNKQKVGLVQAFIHRPELLILDEPTSGLDPLVQQEFYRLLLETRAQGSTIFLSSHVMSEVEQVCDQVGIIRDGKLELVDHVSALKARAVRHVRITFGEPPPLASFAAIEGLHDLLIEGEQLRCTVAGAFDALVKTAARYQVLDIVSQEPDLEDIFLSYYQGEEIHA